MQSKRRNKVVSMLKVDNVHMKYRGLMYSGEYLKCMYENSKDDCCICGNEEPHKIDYLHVYISYIEKILEESCIREAYPHFTTMSIKSENEDHNIIEVYMISDMVDYGYFYSNLSSVFDEYKLLSVHRKLDRRPLDGFYYYKLIYSNDTS